MNKVTHTSLLAKIRNFPPQPIQMFKSIFERAQQRTFPMNLATVDKKFGVLNRTVMFRNLQDDCYICFDTARNSRKYLNLKENPKLGLTLLFSLQDCKSADGKVLPETWQIRLLDAEAVELDEERLQQLWKGEPLYAKIRSYISECGKPRCRLELEERCKELLECAERANGDLEISKSFAAFKIIPKRWDFYKTEPEKIADRVHYKLVEHDLWKVYHVDDMEN